MLMHARVCPCLCVSVLCPSHCVYRKDVRIPQELRRVMAAEAEAAREAKAKVSMHVHVVQVL